MKIYTKKGDSGETGLFGGARVSKDDQRIRAYGTFDELNAFLGLALTAVTPATEPLRPILLRIQGELFQLGAELATPAGKKVPTRLLESAEVTLLESEIDQMESKLAPLKNFILPGGTELSAQLHLARTVSRRAERELVTFHHDIPQRTVLLEYVNRLSDHLFVCARYANHLLLTADIPWHA